VRGSDVVYRRKSEMKEDERHGKTEREREKKNNGYYDNIDDTRTCAIYVYKLIVRETTVH